jgi:hypothetical protein
LLLLLATWLLLLLLLLASWLLLLLLVLLGRHREGVLRWRDVGVVRLGGREGGALVVVRLDRRRRGLEGRRARLRFWFKDSLLMYRL